MGEETSKTAVTVAVVAALASAASALATIIVSAQTSHSTNRHEDAVALRADRKSSYASFVTSANKSLADLQSLADRIRYKDGTNVIADFKVVLTDAAATSSAARQVHLNSPITAEAADAASACIRLLADNRNRFIIAVSKPLEQRLLLADIASCDEKVKAFADAGQRELNP